MSFTVYKKTLEEEAWVVVAVSGKLDDEATAEAEKKRIIEEILEKKRAELESQFYIQKD